MEVCRFGEKNKLQNATIIVAFAGVGKTYCGRKYPNILDLDHLFFKYTYTQEIMKRKTFEELKGTQEERKINPLWPQNFMEKLAKNMQKYDIILIPANMEILECLEEEKWDYILCYPKIECKPIYMKRYRERGTNPEWIDKMDRNFEESIKSFEIREGNKMVLEKDETLEDKLMEMEYIEIRCPKNV